jgi:hypothetical protein
MQVHEMGSRAGPINKSIPKTKQATFTAACSVI